MEDLTPSLTATFDEIADLLAEAATCREKLRIVTWPAGSPAAAALTDASAQFAPAVERLVRSADLWMLIATDQLVGISVIIRSGESLFSLFPLFRSVIEHSAYVVWALDNHEDTRTRAARAALVALKSQDELTGAASRTAGKGSETHVEHRRQGEKLRADVETEFEVEIGNPYTIDGQVLLLQTKIIEHFGERWGGDSRRWVGLYDYLCGTGNHPSFNAYEYFDVQDPTANPPMLSVDGLRGLVQPVMVPYLKALEATTYYLGLPEEPTNEFIDRVNAVLGPTLVPPNGV